MAIDVSSIMLQYAQKVAKARKLSAEFVYGGFLTPLLHQTYDGVVSVVALHHLPDLWKAVALDNIRQSMKTGGRFVLRDVVFTFEPGQHAKAFDGFVNACPKTMSAETNRHIAKEYSTLDWIMDGLLERAGFKIEKKNANFASLVQYLCIAV